MAEKILGVGFHKTGTTSLGDALELLGYKRQGWKGENSLMFHKGDIDGLIQLTDEYDAFEDFPWPLLFREIHARHPQIKFILTHRKSMDVWFESLAQHCDRKPPSKTDFRRHLYGVENPRDAPEHVKAVHQAHIDDVRAYASKENIPLLELCPEDGDGWVALCAFLGKKVPKHPYPHSNKKPSGIRMRFGAIRRQAVTLKKKLMSSPS